jgi:hypothetical protein
LPEFVRESRDVIVSEGDDAMPQRRPLSMMMRVLGLLQCLPGMLVPRQVILLPVLLGNPMGVRGGVV